MCVSMLLPEQFGCAFSASYKQILNVAGTADGLILAFLCLMCIYASMLIRLYACPAGHFQNSCTPGY